MRKDWSRGGRGGGGGIWMGRVLGERVEEGGSRVRVLM